jgi:hypothetical protein
VIHTSEFCELHKLEKPSRPWRIVLCMERFGQEWVSWELIDNISIDIGREHDLIHGFLLFIPFFIFIIIMVMLVKPNGSLFLSIRQLIIFVVASSKLPWRLLNITRTYHRHAKMRRSSCLKFILQQYWRLKKLILVRVVFNR